MIKKIHIKVVSIILLFITGCVVSDENKVFDLNFVEKFESTEYVSYANQDQGIIINNVEELVIFIGDYSANLDENKYNNRFFRRNTLVFVGIYHSSTDTDIGINQPLKIEDGILNVTIDANMPEFHTYDVKFTSLVIEVSKKFIKGIDEVKIIINNTCCPYIDE